MARLEQPFLTADEAGQGSRSTKVWAVVAAAALAVAAFVSGAEFGRQTPRWHAAHGVSLTLGNGTSQIPTALYAQNILQCYPFTGGTCNVNSCYSWRDSQCHNGYCICEGTTCSGVDGKCYEGPNKPVAAGFTLTNVKWPTQKMYMPATAPMNSMKTTSFPSNMNQGKDKFTLYRLHGNVSGLEHKGYFLSTQAYPEYVVAVRATTGTAASPFGAYEVGLTLAFTPQRLALRVCSKGHGKVMLGGQTLVGNMEWLYIHHFSWIVYGYSFGDPGDGGVWTVDPPIPENELEPCLFSGR